MTPTHRVTVRNSATELLFTDLAPAHAEFLHRAHEGQPAILWQWLPSRDGVEEACWDVLASHVDYDDMRDEQVRRYDAQPWPNEDADMEAARGIR